MGEQFIGTIKNHVWTFNNREHWQSFLNTKPDGEYVLRPPTNLKGKRRIEQNNLYWKRNDEISQHTGYMSTYLHILFMQMAGFLKEEIIFGTPISARMSSTELTIPEFSQLMKQQDKVVSEINDGIPIESWIRLTTTDPLVNEN